MSDEELNEYPVVDSVGIKMSDEEVQKLWNDFIKLIVKHNGHGGRHLGFWLTVFTSKMMYDMSPDEETAMNVLFSGLEKGEELSKSDVNWAELWAKLDSSTINNFTFKQDKIPHLDELTHN